MLTYLNTARYLNENMMPTISIRISLKYYSADHFRGVIRF